MDNKQFFVKIISIIKLNEEQSLKINKIFTLLEKKKKFFFLSMKYSLINY